MNTTLRTDNKRTILCSNDKTPRVKRKRKSYGLDVKIEVIRRRMGGERVISIARCLKIPETTIHTILNNQSEIESRAENMVGNSKVKITRKRSEVLEIMERRLATWIEDLYQQHIPVSLALIQEEALSLYRDIRKEKGEDATENPKNFVASKGWFHRFQKRYGFKKVKVQAEAANADLKAAELYPLEFKTIVAEGKYNPKQIFNIDEMGLIWKQIPSRTTLSIKEETPDFKSSRDRITLLIGGNANGDKKLTPLLVYHSENPKALKNISKDTLPIIWKSQRRAYITKEIFHDWFTNFFVPEVKKYCEDMNLEFKILLVVGNAVAHNINVINDVCPNVKIMFLPPKTILLMQPMNQGVIAVLKAYYLRLVFRKLISETDTNNEKKVGEFWKKFNILDSILMIAEAWKEISSSLINGSWQNLYPDAVDNYNEFNVNELQNEIASLAIEAGFQEVNNSDIAQLLESDAGPLTNDELAELEKQTPLEEVEHEHEIVTKDFKINELHDALEKIDQVLDYFCANDPSFDRAVIVKREIKDVLLCYNTILSEKIYQIKNQRIQDSYFVHSEN